MSALDPFSEVMMLGRWPVRLPAYRSEHCRVQPNWEEGRLLSMHAHLKPGMVLYDVGAEHGDLSALYGTWVRPPSMWDDVLTEDNVNGGVVLVEGSDRFWPVIRATFDANDLTPLGCYAGFASDLDSLEELRTPSWATPTFTRPDLDGSWPSWADGDPVPHHGFKSLVESKQTIPNIRFDTLATMCPEPDAFTIDVEGAEARVLRGSERLLRDVRPLVWTSVHEELLWFDYPEWDGMSEPDVLPWFVDFMASFGYKSQRLERNHETHVCSWPEERTDFDPWLDVEYLRG